MFKKKSKITTIVLIIITFLLLGTTIYISSFLSSDSDKGSSIAPHKTKAANITYSKLIALNTEPTELPTSSDSSSLVEETSTPTPTLIPTEIQPTESGQTPTPTEIILAYKNPTITKEATDEAWVSNTVSPTKLNGLPDAGFVYNGLIIFTAAALLVLFSFLF